LESDKEGETLI